MRRHCKFYIGFAGDLILKVKLVRRRLSAARVRRSGEANDAGNISDSNGK